MSFSILIDKHRTKCKNKTKSTFNFMKYMYVDDFFHLNSTYADEKCNTQTR